MRVANSDPSLLVNDSIVQASDFIPRSEEVSNPDGSKPKRGSSLRLFIGWLIVFALLWRMQYIDPHNLESVVGAILMAVLGIGLLLRWPAKNIGITMASTTEPFRQPIKD